MHRLINRWSFQLKGCAIRWRIVFAMAALLASALFPSSLAFADRLRPEPDISLKSINLGDLTAYGGAAKLDIWFPGYGDYELKEGNYLSLEYDHSELVHPSISSVTVLLNDVPITSTFLNEKNQGRTIWRIVLPKDKLKRDLNHVELRYYMRFREGYCIDNESLALYSTVYASSFIHYEYVSPLKFVDLPPLDLGRFPEPFIRPTIATGEVAMIVPDNASFADFSAAASIAARFGQLAGGKPFTATLHYAGDIDRDLLAGRDIVVIGKPDENLLLQDLAKWLPLKPVSRDGKFGYVDESGVPIELENGVLQEIVSPWDRRFAILVVSGGTDGGVLRAARALSSRLGAKPLQGPYAIVTQATEALAQGEEPRYDGSQAIVSLKQLGLSDFVAKGVGEHTMGFVFDAPPHGRETAYFDLVLSHSPLLDQDRSSVAVMLNDVPLRSLLLKSGSSEWYTQRIALPSAGLRPGINSIMLKFHLYPERAEDCGPLAGERAWAVLRSDSQLLLPVGAEPPPLDLAHLPYPFVRRGMLTGLLLALPNDRSVLKESLQVAVAFGRQALGGSSELQAGLADDIDDEAKRRYDIVAYGRPENNVIIAEVAHRLPLALEGDWQRSLQRSDFILLGLKDAANLGIAELIASPWNAEKRLLVLSGTSINNVSMAPKVLTMRLLPSNVAVISEEGRMTGIRISGGMEAGVASESTQRKLYTVASIPVLLMILGTLGIMVNRVGSSRS